MHHQSFNRSCGISQEQQTPSTSQPAAATTPQPIPSRAGLIWLVVVVSVLTALAIEMHGEERPAYNLVVTMTGDAQNCEVSVDGNALGRFDDKDESGVENHSLWLRVPDGKHVVELKKDGLTIESREIEVKSKAYLRFDSGNASRSN